MQPPPQALRDQLGLSLESWSSGLRLLLAHVGLDRGQLWVAAADGGTVVSAVALLPPRVSSTASGLELAVRLGLGAAAPSAFGGFARRPRLDRHWLVLPAAAGLPDHGPLLRRALRHVDVLGQGAYALPEDPSPLVLREAGFTPDAAAGLLVRYRGGPAGTHLRSGR